MDRIEKALAKARREKAAAGRPGDPPAERQAGAAATETPNFAPVDTKGGMPPYNGSIVALNFDDATADLFRILRTQIVQALDKKKGSALGVCSARAGEGKTFVAANIAASIALSQEHSVLLIDLDLRRPTIHKLFRLDPNPGVTDFIGGNARLPDCIRRLAVAGLEIITAGTAIRNSSEALGSSELARAFAGLRAANPARIIVCDLPPLLASDDALMFGSQLDATLLVVEEGRTRPGEIQRSLNLLASSNLLGTVLNKSRYYNPFPYSA